MRPPDSTIGVFDSETFELLKIFGPEYHYMEKVSISPNGRFIATNSLYDPGMEIKGDEVYRTIIWDGENYKQIKQLQMGGSTLLKFSLDGNYLGVGGGSYIYLYDTKTWDLVDTFKFDGLSIYCFTFSNDSKLLYLINDNGGIEVYQIKNKQYVRTIGPKWGSILLNISYNNNFIVGCGGHYVMMWKNTLTSINEQLNQKVEITPNPVKGTLTINNIQFENYDIEIYDINSNIMFNKIGIVNQNSTFSIDANFLPSGVYILKLKSNGKEINTKFIKE